MLVVEPRSAGSAFGAWVRGVDLNEHLSAPDLATIHAALLRHSVLVFRGQQQLTPAALVRFTARFGAVEEHVLGNPRLDPNDPLVRGADHIQEVDQELVPRADGGRAAQPVALGLYLRREAAGHHLPPG